MSESSNLKSRLIVRDVVSRVVEWMAGQAKLKGIGIDVQVPASIEVFSDERILETILRNLVSNAIKYSEQGGAITLHVSLLQRFVLIKVIDHGQGMKPETLLNLFGNTRVKSVVGTRGERGNGMGLVFCNDLVRSIGGRLEAESIPGTGSTFSVVLPEIGDANR